MSLWEIQAGVGVGEEIYPVIHHQDNIPVYMDDLNSLHKKGEGCDRKLVSLISERLRLDMLTGKLLLLKAREQLKICLKHYK